MKNLVQIPVSEVMTTRVVTASPYDTLAKIYEVMETRQIRRLPVVDDGKLIGIVSLKDILSSKPSDVKHSAGIEEVFAHLSKLIVSVAMTPDPVTIYQSAPIGHAAELMLGNKIGGLPVLDADGNLAGIVTESDLFRLIVRHWRDENLITSGIG